MQFGHIVATEPLKLRRIALIETAIGDKFYYILSPDESPLPDGTLVSFEKGEIATKVTAKELPSTVGKEISRGQTAMETWAEQTADIRAGLAPNPLGSEVEHTQ